ncbi:hypothetical protein BC939DRAFT_443064 [Gamsiella multidivaricata]|uniref:uncharacterized protein n=1 Tax=Gamsiella multidivaricata TaxID=101098 RepID=UPI002220084D|nr:uncharacterized protein BC939DRAFT_443064 [Gamsiella multidivaricata]KAI7828828.1 hypothetical protein BC939DRAFT_443064 [Gamsiella multidivaricata]
MLPLFMSEIGYNVVMVEHGERLWDRGSRLENWNSKMGIEWWLWFVPYHNTTGDGIHDVYNKKIYKRLVGDALAQARMQVVTLGLPTNFSGNSVETGNSAAIEHAGERDMVLTMPRVDPELSNCTTSHVCLSSMGSTGGDENRIPSGATQSSRTNASSEMSSLRMPKVIRQSSGLAGPVFDDQEDGISGSQSQNCIQEYVIDEEPRGHFTPKLPSTRTQGPRQRALKSQPGSSARQRQRTVSGGIGGSYGGPIKDFGMGLGTDGIPVDSGTGLKLSSGRVNRSSQSNGKSNGCQQQD